MTVKKACEILDIMFDPRYKLHQSYKDVMLEEAKQKFLIKIKTNHSDVGSSYDKTVKLIEAHEYLNKILSIKEKVCLKDTISVEELKRRREDYNCRQREKRAAFRLNNPPKPRGKPILQITESGEIVKEWSSAKDAAQALNTDVSAICKCAKGVKYYKLAAGFSWKYKLTQGADSVKLGA